MSVNKANMRITEDQHRAAIDAAMNATQAGYGATPRYRAAVDAVLAELGIEVVKHAGADGDCPDYGSSLDPCPSGCASGVCVHVTKDSPPQASWPRIVGCDDCNLDTHRCPGCGTPLPHGQGVCAECEDRIGREIYGQDACICDPAVKQYCASGQCVGGSLVPVWVERTWLDVRTHDIVRPPKSDHWARVVMIGPVTPWHVDSITKPQDAQYRPGEHRQEWSTRRVTLLPVHDGAGEISAPVATFSPDHGMRPDAPVEIRTTQVEVDAIELLGGWPNRVDLAQVDVQ